MLVPDRSGPVLYLHIGIPKTASSWLQAEVFPKLDHLLYRDSPRSDLFRGVQDAADEGRMMVGALKRSSRLWRDYGDTVFRELFGERSAWLTGARSALVSEEGIGRQGSRPESLRAHLREMAKKAADWGFERVGVIYFVRRQDRWLASHYAQVSDRNPKAGQGDFERLVHEVTSPRLARYGFGTLLDYEALHEALVGAVGPENVLPFVHEDLQEDQGGTLGSLLGHLGLPQARIGEVAREVAGGTRNVRSSQDAWRLRAAPRRIRGVRIPGLPPAAPGRIVLTPEISKAVLEAYARSNEAFATAAGLNLRRHGYVPYDA